MRRDSFSPTAELREIRESKGVREFTNAFGMQSFLITRHEDIKAVLADHERFSNERPLGFAGQAAQQPSEEEAASARAGNLLGLDPPNHSRLRRMLTPEFTIRRMKRLEPRIVEIVDAQLDAMESAGPPVDLVENFALPIPSLVICELLGVPYDDREDFQRRSVRQLDFSVPIPERLELQRQGRAYMTTLVARARRQPGEDILGMLVREHGDELTDDELVGVASLLLLAGHETTSNMLGLGTLALLRHPQQLAVVRDAPDAVSSPDTLDIGRGAPGHLAFGHGVHHCLGAPLARMEMRIAFPALLRRFPELALAEDFTDVQFRSFHFIYGLKSLEVAW